MDDKLAREKAIAAAARNAPPLPPETLRQIVAMLAAAIPPGSQSPSSGSR